MELNEILVSPSLMYRFIPRRVYIEERALSYPLGVELRERFEREGVGITFIGSHNRIAGISGKTEQQAYAEAKNTLVVGVRKSSDFESCKPSAHYQLPLATSCPGMCEYCYLQTTLGKKPYIRIYVNIDEILTRTREYIDARAPEITFFEGAAASDPIPVEEYSGSLARTIDFLGQQKYGRFRFVTKFTDIDSLLTLKHNGHTTFRFSINSESVIKRFEHRTPPAKDRITAAGKAASSGYPMGFLIAPIFYYDGWKEEYLELLLSLKEALGSIGNSGSISFELITHRYTLRAKSNILSLFPETELPMDEEDRRFKYGQFGYGKYMYKPEKMDELKSFFTGEISRLFPTAEIEYFV